VFKECRRLNLRMSRFPGSPDENGGPSNPELVYDFLNKTIGEVAIRPARTMNRNRRSKILFMLAAGMLIPSAAGSHHSFTAEFVADKTATLKGTITQVWFRNPHVRYLMVVANEDGEEDTWDARGSPVVWLARKGWKKDTIEVGDVVEMYGFLGRDGIKMLSIMTITLADGTVLIDKVPE